MRVARSLCRAALLACSFILLAASCAAPENDETKVISTVTRCAKSRPAPELPELPFAGTRAEFFAQHPLAEVLDRGGHVLAAPRMIGVFFGDDPLQELSVAFMESYGCTEHFRNAVNEYGVGDATYARTIVLPEYPELESDELYPWRPFEEWIREQLAAGLFGVLGEQDLLMFFLPKGVEKEEGVGGFHSQVSPTVETTELAGEPVEAWLEAGAVPYAVVYSKDLSEGRSLLAGRTLTISHELIEAATVPYPSSSQGISGLRQRVSDVLAHSATLYDNLEELSDLCNFPYAPLDYPFVMARAYSNRRARAGQDPCSENLPIEFLVAPHKLKDGYLYLDRGEVDIALDVYVANPRHRLRLVGALLEFDVGDEDFVTARVPTGELSAQDGETVTFSIDPSALPLIPRLLDRPLSDEDDRLLLSWCEEEGDCESQSISIHSRPPSWPEPKDAGVARDGGVASAGGALGDGGVASDVDASLMAPPAQRERRLAALKESYDEAHPARLYYVPERQACLTVRHAEDHGARLMPSPTR